MKRWRIEAGNSNEGPVGFVIYDLQAETAEDALTKLREAMPQHVENKMWVDDSGEERMTVVTYFNPENLTVENIEEDEDEDA
jgi:hypothetical protein